MDTTTTPPVEPIPSEERLWAAIAHATAMLIGWGLIGPVLVWVMQRRKSAYASFHALQALTYQVFFMLYYTVMITCLSLLFVAFTFGFIIAMEPSGMSEPPLLLFIGEFAYFLGMFAAFGVYVLLGLVGAGMCLAGKDFRYPLLGRWIERYLGRRAASAAVQEETA